MEIIKNIEETRNFDDLQENTELIQLLNYLKGIEIYDNLWGIPQMIIRVDFIRRFSIIEKDGEIIYEIRYDGLSALGTGKGITKTIPPELMRPYTRMMKLKNIM